MKKNILALLVFGFLMGNAQIVSGIITDRMSGEGLVGVELNVLGRTERAISGERGQFSFKVQSSFPCIIEFTFPEYQLSSVNLKEPQQGLIIHLSKLTLKDKPKPKYIDVGTYQASEVDTTIIFSGCSLKGSEKEKFECSVVAIKQFVKDNVVYPKEAKKNKIEGQVLVGFVVDQNGRVNRVEVLKGNNQLLNKEAVRVVWRLPKMKPAVKNGQNVKMAMEIPVHFKL